MGGWGNQAFQIATTIAYAKDNGFEYGFDLGETLLPYQGKPAWEYKRNLYFTLPQISHQDYQFEEYQEPRWEYTPIPAKDNVVLNGYFQSPKYFDKHKELIRSTFFNDDVVYGIRNRVEDRYCVELNNSIGVHVRRGDYLQFSDIHPTLPISYYMEAISKVSREAKVNCVLIFSDDIEWCKREFRSPNVRFVEGLEDYEALCLMSLCDHNIIANSSFSWWGAYLNDRPYQKVVAPKQWFGAKVGHGWQDIYTKDMIIL